MTDKRWQQIEALCHAALGRVAHERQAFLLAACAGDERLLSEVESLLAQEGDAERFLRAPAVAVAGSVDLSHGDGTLVGYRLGSYTFRSLLGVGGMGEVYRAHDEILAREVAIKVLPAAFTEDPERRARFEREARLLATLNHPHIGAIYGVEEAHGVRGLVLELVEGETLAQRIATAATRGSSPRVGSAVGPGLPISEVLSIGRQVADALDTAHQKGIVHRDLKPANIKITPDGVVKVLDFGLAKASGVDGAPADLAESRVGVILGTAAYMSPEQARGHSVDKRGDIWAFGCVLYEMLTGRLAFSGDTASDTLAKILEREPDWAVLPTSTPEPVRQLLRRCLAKDPKQRVRDIGDVRFDLNTRDDTLPPRGEVHATVTVPSRTSRKLLLWTAVGVLVVGAGLWEAGRLAATPENPLVNAQFSRLTDWEGTEGGASISPDGRFVTFIADHDGQYQLWVSQVGTGNFLNLTREQLPLDRPDGLLRTAGFSGDGGEIWFAAGGDASSPKKLIPLTGGKPRAFLGQGFAAPSWSADGSQTAYFSNGDGDPLFVADRSGADRRRIVLQPKETDDAFFKSGMHSHNPIWSQDGQWIYFVHGRNPTVETELWRVRPSGGVPEQLTDQHMAVNSLAVVDARTVFYTARPKDGSGPRLWELDVPSKVSRRISSGLERYSWVAASRDGRRIVATWTNPNTNLWRVPMLDRVVEDPDVQPFPVSTGRALAPRFSDTSVFYLAARGSNDGLWRAQDGQTSLVWAGQDGLSEPAAVAKDERVAIVFRENGKPHLQVMSADGTNARTLAATLTLEGAANQSTVAWSPDGSSIVTGGSDADGTGLFSVPVDGGVIVRLLKEQATNPVWSPDGTFMVLSGKLVGGVVPLLAIRPDGTRVTMTDLHARPGGYRFLPNGKGLVYLPRLQSLDFWLFDFATQTSRQLTRLGEHGSLQTFDITPDGKYIVFDRSRENSDVVLIDLPK